MNANHASFFVLLLCSHRNNTIFIMADLTSLDKNDILSYCCVMKLMNRKELERFKNKHPQSIKPLIFWESIVGKSFYRNFSELRKTFPSADYVPCYTVFNIGGNKYRLIAEIDYEFQLIDIKVVWTHAEYSQKINCEKLSRGRL